MTYVAADVNAYNAAYAGAVAELAASRPELALSHIPSAVAESIDCAVGAIGRPLSDVEYFSIQRWAARVVKVYLPANLERDDLAFVGEASFWRAEADRFVEILQTVWREYRAS
jgi:hypothetical protein